MGYFYDLNVYMDKLDNWSIPVYAGWIIAMICFYWYYYKSLRQGFKDKCGGMPWQTNMWNFANDFIYVIPGFARWWSPNSPTHHWVTIFLWFGLVVWFGMEFVAHYQSIKWDLQTEIFPHAKSRKQAILMYCGVQLGFIAAYAYLWSIMSDPLCHLMFLTTFTGCVIFNFQLMGKRRSNRGLHWTIPVALTVAQIAGYFIILPSIDSTMAHDPWVYVGGVAATAFAIAFGVVLKGLPKWNAEKGAVEEIEAPAEEAVPEEA